MAQRFDHPPMTPDPYASDCNSTLLSTTITAKDVSLAPDGISKLYTMAGTYVYSIDNPLNVQSPGIIALYGTFPPYMNENYTESVVVSSFTPNILNNGCQSSSSVAVSNPSESALQSQGQQLTQLRSGV
jgi:hypothetical protein